MFETSSYPPSMPPPPSPLLSDLKYTSNITLIISIHCSIFNQSSFKTFKLVFRAPKMSKCWKGQWYITFSQEINGGASTLYCSVYVNVYWGILYTLYYCQRILSNWTLSMYLTIYLSILYLSIYLFISLSFIFCKSVSKEICRF